MIVDNDHGCSPHYGQDLMGTAFLDRSMEAIQLIDRSMEAIQPSPLFFVIDIDVKPQGESGDSSSSGKDILIIG